jgi:hypothetical protein
VVALLATLALAGLQQGGGPRKSIDITRNPDEGVAAMLLIDQDPLSPPRLSPKEFGEPPQPWLFPWLSRGYVNVLNNGQMSLRFRVYSQDRKGTGDPAESVSRMLTALWELNYKRLKLDHSVRYNGQIVDVFLCTYGLAGGEQRFDIAVENNQSRPVNTIYIYDIASFTDPIEAAREVAHEYGHAALPAIGTYTEPEDWANGYLGEKLYLRWLRDAIANKRAFSEDAMGVSPVILGDWVKKNVDPLVVKASQAYPSHEFLSVTSKVGMDRYIGLVLYADSILPDSVFGRSLLLTGSTEAVDYPAAIALAAEEPDRLEIEIPTELKGKTLWIPVNKGRVQGAKVLRRIGKWAQIQPTTEAVAVVNRKPEGE